MPLLSIILVDDGMVCDAFLVPSMGGRGSISALKGANITPPSYGRWYVLAACKAAYMYDLAIGGCVI